MVVFLQNPGSDSDCTIRYYKRWLHFVIVSFYDSRLSRWFCMLDAATYVATSQLDLSAVKPDFVCLSFYKIFGLPTGLGALIVHNSSAYTLNKKYYGGGTVEVALPARRCHTLRQNLYERYVLIFKVLNQCFLVSKWNIKHNKRYKIIYYTDK